MQRNTRSFILLVPILLIGVSCQEDIVSPLQFGAVHGTVLTSEDAVPMVNVLISTNPATESAMTGAAGEFVLPEMPEGTYVISAEKEGYTTGHVSITVRGGKQVRAIITMSRKTTTSVVPTPKVLHPKDKGVEEGTEVVLLWSRGIVKPKDSLYYAINVYDGATSQIIAKATGLRDTSFVLAGLHFGSSYYWQVIGSNDEGTTTNSDVWSFRVRDIPDNRITYSALVGKSPELFSTDSTAANTVQLTNEPSQELWPRWNRSRSKLAFISDREGAFHVYTMNQAGGDIRRVTTLPVAGYQNNGIGYCWTPDGGWIFYAHYDKLYRVDQFGSNRALIASAPPERHFREVEWSQQYDRLVVHTVGVKPYDSEIHIMKPDGTIENQLVGNVPGTLGSPSFSIDGRSVIFTRDISGYEASDARQLDSRIMIMTLDQKDTVDVSHLKNDGTNDLYPRCSPDGAWIIFTNQPNDNSSEGAIWIMRRDGTERRRLIISGRYPDWK